MSKADEMFKKLGYQIKYEHSFLITALYGKGDKRIGFYDETVDCYNGYDGSSDYISMQELQAINEKCKEMGWIK